MKTVGEMLKHERERLKITVEDIEKTTRIRKKYLTAIEKSDWAVFPSKTYILGILKTYGSQLNFDETKLIAFFRREYEQVDSQKFKRKIAHIHFVPSSKTYLRIGIALTVILFVAYFGFQITRLIIPPRIEVISPTSTYLPPRTNKFDLIGKTDSDAIVKVDGQNYSLDEKNQFYVKIPIDKKGRTIVIEITGANGKKTTIRRTFKVL